MIWMLPILSGVFDAAQRGVIKATNTHRLLLAAGGYYVTIFYYLIWLFLEGIPSINSEFWLINAVDIPLAALGVVLTIEAHRSSPLILTAPYLSLTPALLLVTTPIISATLNFLNIAGGQSKMPTIWGLAGVVILTLGIYVLNTREAKQSLLEPFRKLKSERGSRLMLAVAALWSINGNLDFAGIQNANAPLELLILHGGLAILLTLTGMIYVFSGRIRKEEIWPVKGYGGLILFGSAVALSMILHFLAFYWIPMVSFVIAGKRTGAILAAIVVGLTLAWFAKHERFAEEKAYLKYRIPGVLIMITGMLIIILYGTA